LRPLTDSRSDLKHRFLDALATGQHCLPDEAQKQILEAGCPLDFFYAPNICVFYADSVHDQSAQVAQDAVTRRKLQNLGYRMITIRYNWVIGEQIAGIQISLAASARVGKVIVGHLVA
jgi:hypothetical protein